MSIEILENTLLKLLVRRGTDADRLSILLDDGELGYSTNTNRLFIGDGVTYGGVLIGNKLLGAASDITTLIPAQVGDIAFDSDNNILYRLASGSGSSIGDWSSIGTLNTSTNGTIVVSATNGISVGTLSAGNFDTDSLGSSIELDGSNRVALSGTINIDGISQRTVDVTSYLRLPPKIAIDGGDYTFPNLGPSFNGAALAGDIDGKLSWGANVVTAGVSPTTAALIPVGTITPFVSSTNAVPYGWLPCDGRTVGGAEYPELSALIGNTYGGTDPNFKVPDYTGQTLYGSVDPANSTLYSVNTSVAASLSSIGTMFIIKSIGGVTAPLFTVTHPLSSSINTLVNTGNAFNPLSGNIEIGLGDTRIDDDFSVTRTVFVTPTEVFNEISFLNKNTPWTEVDVSSVVSVSAKAVYCTYTAEDGHFHGYWGLNVGPAADGTAGILANSVGKKHGKHTHLSEGSQFMSRIDRNTGKFYIQNTSSTTHATDMTIQVYAYGE